MREVIIEVIVQVIGALLMGVIGVAFAYLTKLVGKTKELEHVASAMDELESVVTTVVGDLQQTIVENLKAASADGKLSQEDIYDLGKLLVMKVKEQLSNPASTTIQAAGIDMTEAIHSIAEAYIARIKRETNFINIGEAVEAE
jgi:hypothetical protein